MTEVADYQRAGNVATASDRDAPAGALRSILLPRLILLAVLLAVWEYAGRNWIDPFWISQPSLIAERLWDWLLHKNLVWHVSITLVEAILGFVAGTTAGGTAGFLLGWFKRAADVLDPFIVAIYSLPKVALAPLFILWFGIGIETKIILTAVIVFFLVFFNTYAGVRDTSRELMDIVRLMGGGTFEIMRRVVLPSALTVIFVGLRVSVPYALIGAVVGEMMASNRGVGFLIVESTGQFDTAGAFGALMVLIAISTTLNGSIVRLERYLLRWKETRQ